MDNEQVHTIFDEQMQCSPRTLYYNAFVRSRLTYASQTWTLTVAQTRSNFSVITII